VALLCCVLGTVAHTRYLVLMTATGKETGYNVITLEHANSDVVVFCLLAAGAEAAVWHCWM
jgi:hypothetical protein